MNDVVYFILGIVIGIIACMPVIIKLSRGRDESEKKFVEVILKNNRDIINALDLYLNDNITPLINLMRRVNELTMEDKEGNKDDTK